MYLVLIILAIIVCIFLGLIVLIQNPKGGGLASNFSSSSQLMGVQKTGDFLEKGTWVLAIGLMVLSLAINVAVKGGATKSDNPALNDQIEKASKPTTPAAAPLSLPATPPASKPADKPAK
ncbi:preprotein translocase subunit SecG [Mucilaginibacter pocheonensis]|uniref:Protein-export membrane protein SecG n=1 Tax=Mucilaginibacter pocheonensis TaxID=398050 RepID=A0ABU1TBW2_9SPHI|nr:preprotein translocase subunit SecG [Mucilaginibacter pocheonensis]MDR6942868.1 preprotein translocase subunit SecG [Mucilaginibacter pocheonensis]